MIHKLGINTILHTKDGSMIGNAIIIGKNGEYWRIKTDYGNETNRTEAEIFEDFNIAWSNFTTEDMGYTCDEMQKMMSANHKHRVEQ